MQLTIFLTISLVEADWNYGIVGKSYCFGYYNINDFMPVKGWTHYAGESVCHAEEGAT